MADIDFEQLYYDAKQTYGRMKDENLWFGSEAYKAAKNQMEYDVRNWEKLMNKKKENPDYKLSDYEIMMINQLLANQDSLIDTYLDNKEEEREELKKKGKKFAENTENRINTVKRAKATISRQMAAIDNELSERIKDQPAPSTEDIRKETESVNKDIKAAESGVWFGSDEYDQAKSSYKDISDLWKRLDESYKDKDPDPGVVQWLKTTIMDAQDKADAYLLKKGDDQLDRKPRDRMKAIGRSRDNMDKMLRKITEWEKKNDEKPLKYDADKALEDSNTLLAKMRDENRGFFIGSSEYRTAMKAIDEQQKLWAKIQAKGKNYVPTTYELKQLEDANNKVDKAVDAYLNYKVKDGMKYGKVSRRVAIMQRAKNHVSRQKRMIAASRKSLEIEANSMNTFKTLGSDASKIETDLDKATEKVHFGSKAYKNARRKYVRSNDKWAGLETQGKDHKPSDAEISKLKAEMQDTIKAIDTYLDSKKDKDLSKKPKTRKRVEAMEKARRNLELRIRKLEYVEKKRKEEADKNKEAEFDERVKNLKNDSTEKTGLEKHASRASLAATQKLANLAQKSTLTTLDKKEARRAVAALIMEERIKDFTDEERKKLKKSNAYAEAVKKIADSKELKAVLPDSKLTPLNFKQFTKNPETVKKIAGDFNQNLLKSAKAKKKAPKPPEKKEPEKKKVK